MSEPTYERQMLQRMLSESESAREGYVDVVQRLASLHSDVRHIADTQQETKAYLVSARADQEDLDTRLTMIEAHGLPPRVDKLERWKWMALGVCAVVPTAIELYGMLVVRR